MKSYRIKQGIKTWAEEDRPREKLKEKGRSSLSNAELLSIVIGSGNRSQSAVELGRQILATVNHDLNSLAKLDLADLIQFPGVGEAKAISIIAAMELGRRRRNTTTPKQELIRQSGHAYDFMRSVFLDLQHEEFWVLFLRQNLSVIKKEQLSIGGLVGTIADIRIILRNGLKLNAAQFMVFHNHPSGNLNPSQADISLTKKLSRGADMLDMRLLDHLIITNDGYFSFADEGLI